MTEQDLGVGYRECVLDPIAEWQAAGYGVALVTVTGIEGGSPRPLGSQMAVRSDGLTVGLVTGGCAEQAIIAEALSALKAGAAHTIRFGKGSPYMDIQLPCGSGLDMRFEPAPGLEVISELIELRNGGTSVGLLMPGDCSVSEMKVATTFGPRPCVVDAGFWRPYGAAMTLVIAGRGPICTALATQACAAGMDVTVLSPDEFVTDASRKLGATSIPLQTPQSFDADLVGPTTALVLMFHDHDWEPEILANALPRHPFYVGALGSRATHRQRLSVLADRGVPADLRAKIRGPVGVDLGAEGPFEIAVAVMADLVACRGKAGLPPL